MSDEELRKAIARIRRVKAGETIIKVYGELCDMPGHAGSAWLSDRALIADEYLADLDRREMTDDSECKEADGCPTEGAVLKRFWRQTKADLDRRQREAEERVRPACYAHLSEEEWRASCAVMFSDLNRLAREDGCIAAAWALEVLSALGVKGGA